MRIFNRDGFEADMCGNGLRCLALYLKNLFGKNQFLVETNVGVLSCQVLKDDYICIKMPSPEILYLNLRLDSLGEFFVVDTGVPHAVLFVEDVEKVPVLSLGKEVRFHPKFAPKGVNVNFVQKLSSNTCKVRTYERGVEGETLSCGTGCAASALALFQEESSYLVRTFLSGGQFLEFAIEKKEAIFQIEMRGEASFVFEGKVPISFKKQLSEKERISSY